MSLKAKIEAVIYAAEEPITLAQLAAIFAKEALASASLPFENTEAAGPNETGVPQIRGPHEQVLVRGVEVSPLRPGMLQPDSSEEPESALLPEDTEAKKQSRLRDREARVAVRQIVEELIREYASGERGMEIREIAGGYRMATKAEYHDAVRSFVKSLKPQMKLSLQALETLAVIAYKQPVTAPEISEIRGVDTSGVLGSLMARKLITTAGRKQVIGRPILYKTTKEFLLRFGLKDVGELPSIEEFEKMAADMAGPETEEMYPSPPETISQANVSEEASDAASSEAFVTESVTEEFQTAGPDAGASS